MKTRAVVAIAVTFIISLSMVLLSEASLKNHAIEASGVLEEDKVTVSIPTELAAIGAGIGKQDKSAINRFSPRKPLGTIKDLRVTPGDLIKAGDTLLVIDRGPAESNLRQVRAQYDFVLASIGNLEEKSADLAEKKTELDDTENQLKSKRASAQREFAAKSADGKAKIAQVEKKLAEVKSGLAKAKEGLAAVTVAESQARRMLESVQRLPNTDPTKATRLSQARNALGEITKKKNSLNSTIGQLSSVKFQLEKGLAAARQGLESGRNRFNEGLGKMDEALTKISDGRSKIGDAVTTVSKKTNLLEKKKAQAKTGVSIAEKLLDKTEIKAVRSGRVIELKINEGSVIYPGQKVMAIASEDILKLGIYVPVGDVGSISKGMLVEVIVDAAPGEEFEGRIAGIGKRAVFAPPDMATDELELVRVVKIKVEVKNKDGILKAGMPADVIIN